MITLTYTLRVIIYREEARWIAHCLEMDLVADGRSPARAIQHLRGIIDFQISSILQTGNLESLFMRAPSDIVALFMAATNYRVIVVPTKYIEGFYIKIASGY